MITRVEVTGYKSLREVQGIEIRPLTLLAGANSSGKSSIIQPLLLLKQTLETSYDPGVLFLNGPNVRFTAAEQLLSRTGKRSQVATFKVSVETNGTSRVAIQYKHVSKEGLDIEDMEYTENGTLRKLRLGMSRDEIAPILPDDFRNFVTRTQQGTVEVVRRRCFLDVLWIPQDRAEGRTFTFGLAPTARVETALRSIVHVPGLRGNPERDYSVSAVGPDFPGTFETYVAGVIARWQADKAEELDGLGEDLELLGLTWKVSAKHINETQVELQVGRLSHAVTGGAHDLVSIADVGFGVSQTLPILVALRAARPGQLIYLEQPEIHLHPRAQAAMATVLANAIRRGVRVVVETHSSILLLEIQALVARGEILTPSDVKLHWFARRPDGATVVSSTDLDEAGTFGDWPEDFGSVEMDAQKRFFDASEAQLRKK